MKRLLFFVKIILSFSEDVLIAAGLFFILRATFLINYVAGLYVTGFVLLALGYLISRRPSKRR